MKWFWLKYKIAKLIIKYLPTRFGTWLELEDIKAKIVTSIRQGGTKDFPSLVTAFVYKVIRIFKLEDWPWILVFNLFEIISMKYRLVSDLPILTRLDLNKSGISAWDYDNRNVILYAHLLAKTYGWDLKYIYDLSPIVGMSLLQEILVENQLDREFNWSLSENSYEYDAGLKKSKFRPLDRPYWMREQIKPPSKTKILKSLIPVGAVDYRSLSEEMHPHEISSSIS